MGCLVEFYNSSAVDYDDVIQNPFSRNFTPQHSVTNARF
jgi:hypothetical protein